MKKNKKKKEYIYKPSIWMNPLVLIGGFILFIALVLFVGNIHHLNQASGKNIIKVFLFCMLIGGFIVSVLISDEIKILSPLIFRIISSVTISILMSLLLQTGIAISIFIIIVVTILGITGPKWINFIDFI